MSPGSASFIKNVLYKLKLDYGTPVDIYRYASQTVDTRTGVIDKPKTVINVSLALVYENAADRERKRTPMPRETFFNYGGYHDIAEHMCVVDAEDLPEDFVPTVEDYIVHDGTRWAISSVCELIHSLGWVIYMKDTEGVPPAQLLEDRACSDLKIGQGVSNAT